VNLSVLWSLKRAAPVLFRHLSAYAELAEQDLGVSRRDLTQRLKAGLIFLVSANFALLMLCAGVVAATWDTPNRLFAIATLGTAFAILALVSGFYVGRRSRNVAFASVRREWQQDRVILEEMFSEPEGGANDDR
jgi:uncharacterized membrane protein YqjE